MRHIVVAGTMLLIALTVTFGTASMLQVMAVAQSHKAGESVVVEAVKPPPATKQAIGKERTSPAVRTAGI